MKTTAQSNLTLTKIFRAQLMLHKVATDSRHYEWLDGEAWYRGEPIAGRATDGERKAAEFTADVEQVIRFMRLENALCSTSPFN